jgi:hypothetical protein
MENSLNFILIFSSRKLELERIMSLKNLEGITVGGLGGDYTNV